MRLRVILAILVALVSVGFSSCGRAPSRTGVKTLHMPMRTDGPKSLDPVRGSTVYDNQAACQIYETLVQYKYLKRPHELEPLLLAKMPEVSEDRTVYHFTLKQGVFFQDDECFPGGKGRELKAADVVYSWKRMADDSNLPKSWWLLKDMIVGFDEYRDQQNAAAAKSSSDGRSSSDADGGSKSGDAKDSDAKDSDPKGGSSKSGSSTGNDSKGSTSKSGDAKGGDSSSSDDNLAGDSTSPQSKFDYDVPVEGLEVINDYEFKVKLKQPIQRFMNTLAMFQLSVVAREAVEHYGTTFGRNPVGTGPFVLDQWVAGKSMVLVKNPKYREAYYPSESMPEDAAAGLDKPAGQRIPIVDRVEITMFVEDQPRWLQFKSGKIDWIQVPAEQFEEVFIKRTRELKPEVEAKGIRSYPLPLLDFIFRGFNMEDELLGGLSEEKRALRQAICLAIDWDEVNETFYNGTNVVYDGPIPPLLEGFPEDGQAPVSYRGPDLDRARELLAKAGYPNGEGLPTIDYYTSRGGNNKKQTEMLKRQLDRVGIKVNPRLVDFSTLIEAVTNKKAPFFAFAWGSDYPDAENNLALFYSKNVSPGSNHFNYQNPEYDKLYDQIRSQPPSPERTATYEKMRDMVIEDCPFSGSMARTRYYLMNPRLKNYKPDEVFYNWLKYLDVK